MKKILIACLVVVSLGTFSVLTCQHGDFVEDADVAIQTSNLVDPEDCTVAFDEHLHNVPDCDLTPVWNDNIYQSVRFIETTGLMTITDPGLDITGLRKGVEVNFQGQLTACMSTDYAALDFTDSSGVHIRGLRLVGDSECKPKVGILLARDSATSRSAGAHHFVRTIIGGKFRLAAMYVIGSELSRLTNAKFSNKDSSAYTVVYLGRYNRHNIVGAHGLTPGNSATASEFIMSGLSLKASTDYGLVLAGFSRVQIFGLYISNTNASGYVYIDNTEQSASGISLYGLYGAGSVTAGVEIEGVCGQGLVNVNIKSVYTGDANYPVVVREDFCLTALHVEHADVNGVLLENGVTCTGCSERGREDSLPLVLQ